MADLGARRKLAQNGRRLREALVSFRNAEHGEEADDALWAIETGLQSLQQTLRGQGRQNDGRKLKRALDKWADNLDDPEIWNGLQELIGSLSK